MLTAAARTFYLRSQQIRQRCAEYILNGAPDGSRVNVGPAQKKREQEERYHAMLGDISKQCEHIGRKWDAESWKRLLIDDFAEIMRSSGTPLHHDESGSVTPSLDGRRIVQLGIQSREFWVSEAAAFIDYLFSVGAERGVVWSEPKSRSAEPVA
jgi:hypothetical protein